MDKPNIEQKVDTEMLKKYIVRKIAYWKIDRPELSTEEILQLSTAFANGYQREHKEKVTERDVADFLENITDKNSAGQYELRPGYEAAINAEYNNVKNLLSRMHINPLNVKSGY